MCDKKKLVLDHLYCKFKKELNFFAMKYCPNESEDIVHQAFIKCYENFDPDESEESLKSYLYTTVKNLCLNYLRDKHPLYVDVKPELFPTFAAVDTHDFIYELIESLPSKENKIVSMTIQGYSDEDISAILGMNRNTVHYYKKKAYAKIRNILSK